MFPVPLLAYSESPFLPASLVHFPTQRKGPVSRAGRCEVLHLGRNDTSDPGKTTDSAKSSKTFSCHSRTHKELFLCSMKCQRHQKQSEKPRSACAQSHNPAAPPVPRPGPRSQGDDPADAARHVGQTQKPPESLASRKRKAKRLMTAWPRWKQTDLPNTGRGKGTSFKQRKR